MNYLGKANASDLEELIPLLDDVFFSESENPRMRFNTILPKLYKPVYSPCENNVIVRDGGDIKAAIGLYYDTVYSAGKVLRVGGIGNVAVSKDSRGKGYMIDCMNYALEEMKALNTDYSVLGGDRQRYGYFGYEPVGFNYRFVIDKTNMKHVFSADEKKDFRAVEITPDDKDILGQVGSLYRSAPYHYERCNEKLYDILRSWDSFPYAVFEGEKFVGYFVTDYERKDVREIEAVNRGDILNMVACVMETLNTGSVGFNVPPFEIEKAEFLARICCDSRIHNTEMINIFNFGRFIDAFLSLKAQSGYSVADGTLTVLIHGVKRDENLEVCVSCGKVSVTETDKTPDLELGHSEAIRMLCALFSQKRTALPAFAQTWFPLHFFAHSLDAV